MSDQDCRRRRYRQNAGLRYRRRRANLRRRSFGRVLAQVSQHIALLDKGLAAVRATVRPLVRVRAPVRDQVSFAHEIFGTQIAAERPLGVAALVVRAHMEEKIALQRETLATFCAHKWTFTGMATHMIHEMLLQWKIKDMKNIARLYCYTNRNPIKPLAYMLKLKVVKVGKKSLINLSMKIFRC